MEYALAADEPVIITDLAMRRFRPMPVLLDRGMVSRVLVRSRATDDPADCSGSASRAFHTPRDVQFLRSATNILLNSIDAAHAQHLTER
jgi:citrate lyase alpha subunit